jgi:hypothetical protein
MTFSTDGNAFLKRGVLAAAGLALLAVSACKSGPASKKVEEKSGAQPNSAATAQGGGGRGNVHAYVISQGCVVCGTVN